jgi:O-antigen/teichoic acid export membrane protein
VGRIAVFGAVLNMALNALLIPVFGIWGAAWATFGTWAAYCLVCWIAAWRLRGVAMPPGPLAVILLLSALCLAAQFLWAGAAPVPRLTLDCVAFAAFIVLAAVVYLRRAERQDALTFGQRGFDYVSRQFRLFGKA